MSLALGLKVRRRRSDIGVFPKRSLVLYVPSTRVKGILCYMSLAQGLKGSFVLYVPSTRVKKVVVCHMSLAQGFMKAYRFVRRGSRKRRFSMGVYRFVRFYYQRRVCARTYRFTLLGSQK